MPSNEKVCAPEIGAAPPPSPLPRALTVREVAAALHVTRKTVYRLCASGALPAVRVGGALRVLAGDLTSYLERSKNPPAEPPGGGKAKKQRGRPRTRRPPGKAARAYLSAFGLP